MLSLPSAPPPLGAETAQLVAQKAVTGFLCEGRRDMRCPLQGFARVQGAWGRRSPISSSHSSRSFMLAWRGLGTEVEMAILHW